MGIASSRRKRPKEVPRKPLPRVVDPMARPAAVRNDESGAYAVSYHIAILGTQSAGKTSLAVRFTRNRFVVEHGESIVVQ